MQTQAALLPRHFDNQRYYSYNSYLRSRFGGRVHRVTVDAGFTCPNRDGTVATGGCTYCNNDGFSPAASIYRPRVYMQPTAPVSEQIRRSLPKLRQRYKTDKFLAYFQAFSNTYAPLERLRQLYTEALDHPDIIGLIIGTRPDCVEDDKLDYLAELSRSVVVGIEYGCESIHDKTLRWVNRGHDHACFVDAVHRTAARGIDVAAHVILGFPTETREEMLEMADALSDLPIHAVKIHNLHIVKHTPLAHRYRQQPFHVMNEEEYVELVCDFVERLHPRIAIERLYGDAPLAMMIAPSWSTTGSQFHANVHQRLQDRNTFQGCRCVAGATADVSPII